MAEFSVIGNVSTTISRGAIEVRSYDVLAVDLLVQSLTRCNIYGIKAGKTPMLFPLDHKLTRVLVRRVIPGG
jgi:hypothetical protein